MCWSLTPGQRVIPKQILSITTSAGQAPLQKLIHSAIKADISEAFDLEDVFNFKDKKLGINNQDGILGLGVGEKKNTKEQGWITLRKKLLMRKRRADGDFNLEDALDAFNDDDKMTTTTKAPVKTTTKAPPTTTTTTRSTTTKATITKKPSYPNPKPDDFSLADALDEKNDRTDEKNRGGGNAGGKSFSDDDLLGIVDSGYSPDNPRSKGNTDDRDTTVNIQETTTIAGIASALAMALIGAVTSYISYQQKKFCFSIQQGLNAQQVKGENLEAGLAEDQHAQQNLLQSPSEPPVKV
ncbi:CD99 antigen-like protein 2 isoform X2 [Erpetoichthys calabaricus]|uniref:CD99 antigen-like protein 2 isoform X2 n=1 Tax=Erpetoichthys calabaricus TaxID=27687 RepID=UPI002234872C|nr:CD99 antigen-like protein 2 isoform X2 [Erpetoichthys calabaricus]